MSWDLLSRKRCWGALPWPRRPQQDLYIKLPLPEMTATKPTPWQGITPGDRCNRYAAFHPVDRRNTLCPDREFVTDDTAGFRRRPSMAPVPS